MNRITMVALLTAALGSVALLPGCASKGGRAHHNVYYSGYYGPGPWYRYRRPPIYIGGGPRPGLPIYPPGGPDVELPIEPPPDVELPIEPGMPEAMPLPEMGMPDMDFGGMDFGGDIDF